MNNAVPYGALRRRTPPSHPMIIVMVVPIAASCMLGLPLPGQSQTIQRETPRVERAASLQDRQRLAAECLFAEASPHDPPRHVRPWHSPAKPDSAAATVLSHGQQNAFSHATHIERQGDTALPTILLTSPISQRGPPRVGDI